MDKGVVFFLNISNYRTTYQGLYISNYIVINSFNERIYKKYGMNFIKIKFIIYKYIYSFMV